VFEHPWNNQGIVNPRIIPGFEHIIGLSMDVREILGINWRLK
jgi:hypothetical protein